MPMFTKLALTLAAISMAVAVAAMWPVLTHDTNAPFRISRGYGHGYSHSHSGYSSHSHYGRA